MKKSSFKIHPRLVLISIIIIGFFLRVFNLHWDNGFYLNPDERFLTMIAVALKLPNSFFQYFNPNLSLLNPANINEHFFVYGHLPLSIAKLISVIVKYDNYIVGQYYADIVVDNKIIIELKVANQIENIHKAQLLNYLQASKIKVGYLLNFGQLERLEFLRLIY